MCLSSIGSHERAYTPNMKFLQCKHRAYSALINIAWAMPALINDLLRKFHREKRNVPLKTNQPLCRFEGFSCGHGGYFASDLEEVINLSITQSDATINHALQGECSIFALPACVLFKFHLWLLSYLHWYELWMLNAMMIPPFSKRGDRN